jgi:hypothetical protein
MAKDIVLSFPTAFLVAEAEPFVGFRFQRMWFIEE